MKVPAPPLCVVSLALLAWSGSGQGQAIYKSVDAQGNVTYSSTPPPAAAGVEPVPIHTEGGSTGDPDAAKRRQEHERAAAEARKQRDEQRQRKAAAVAEAEKRLKAARDQLEIAKRRGEADWQTLARGGRVESQAYRDRVEREERKVREAERALRDARAGRLPPEATATPAPPSPKKAQP